MAGPDAQATHAQARTGAPGATVRSYGMGSPAVAGMRGSQGAPPGTPGAFPGTADAWAHAQQVAAVQAAAAQMAQARHLQMPPEKKRRRWPVILVLLLILACLVTALVLALTWQPAKSAREGTELKAGTYPATALFTAYDPATEEQVGQAAAKVAIAVAA